MREKTLLYFSSLACKSAELNGTDGDRKTFPVGTVAPRRRRGLMPSTDGSPGLMSPARGLIGSSTSVMSILEPLAWHQCRLSGSRHGPRSYRHSSATEALLPENGIT